MTDSGSDTTGESFGDDGRATTERTVLRYLVTISLIGMFILMGAATYSVALRGWMACGGGFPKCAGSYIPLLHSPGSLSQTYTHGQILAEWFHRATAFVTGVLMLVATGLAWWRVKEFTITRWSLTAATAVLPLEAYLGVLTGVPNPSQALVAIHLVVSLFDLVALVIAAIILWWSAYSGGRRGSHEAGA
ncbi:MULTISPECIES: hypothetical protein [unclassified Haladaptatus]|uniref:hypothetical protein n=1 Tax=unclassified Haladaptatus TaxID=2622732 RepID=UPI00209C3744|nr:MULTISPECIES: hypothetical protein [unclassified Haladaptatus]MCO8243521.1 hypothetical protein [Haladaptatus sp. AB643]MCO8254930.1 hypothetical protein [Haladaptatus sp. AB618]